MGSTSLDPNFNEFDTDLKVILPPRLQRGRIETVFWALCYIGDLDVVKNLSDDLGFYAYTNEELIKWIQKHGADYNPCKLPWLSPSPAGGGSSCKQPFRTVAVKTAALERDKGRCIITGRGRETVEVCHIYPVALLEGMDDHSQNERTLFWWLLRRFWTEERVNSWEHAVFNQGLECLPEDSVNNTLCLSSEMLRLWNNGAFALRPVALSPDKKELTLQFFWQARPQVHMPEYNNIFEKPLSTRGLDHDIEGNRWCRENGELIKSGDFITMTTDNVGKRPLPSWEIMDMQWNLQRVIGISGAVKILDKLDKEARIEDYNDSASFSWCSDCPSDWGFEGPSGDDDDVSDLERGKEDYQTNDDIRQT